jgi:hypothetical protein
LALVLGSATWGAPAKCETLEAAANRHFQDAISLLNRGEVDAAISEFEAALRVQRHFAVLYDLGNAYALAGRPVEAADTLRRYLDEGGERIDDHRRAEVQAALRLYDGLIGTLVISAPPGSSALLDGKPIATDTPVRIRSGRHGVVAVIDDRPASSRAVDVPAGTTTTLVLEGAPAPESEHAVPGWVQVHCDVPDVGLTIDGKPPLPLGEPPIALTPGPHELVFLRTGYETRKQSVSPSSSELVHLACGLAPRRDLAPPSGAPLRLRVTPATAFIQVDGSPYHGEVLPFGRHRANISDAGFEPWNGLVVLSSSGAAPAAMKLEPTANTIHEREARARNLRNWSYVTAGGVVVTGAIATGLFVVQSNQTAEWRSDRAALARELTQGPATADQLRRAGEQAQRAAEIQRTGDIALALAVTAGALLAVSVGLFLASAHDSGSATSRARLEMGRLSF